MGVALLVGCTPSKLNESEAVNNVLDKAGYNRGELEKLLRHYADDSMKLEAARWLIVNMPGHYSFDDPEIDSLENILGKLNTYAVNFSLDKETTDRWNSLSFADFTRKDHVRCIKADLLIKNIDLAFEEWRGRKWNENLAFADFCELLLPYTLGEARLSDWRSMYRDHYKHKLDSAYQGDDVIEAAKTLLSIIHSEGWVYNSQLITPHLDPALLLNVRVGYNRDFVDKLVYAMRACGIPVAIDQLIISPDNKNSHKWIVLLDNVSGKYIPFGTDSLEPSRDSRPHDGRKKGKVYRTTYERQNRHVKKFEDIRSLPLRIVNPNLLDVTTEYFTPDSATLAVHSQGEGVYLALPVLDEWRPIDAGEVNGDSVTFRNFEAGVYYAPVVPKNNLFYPCGYPFYQTKDGDIKVLKPNTGKKIRLKMSRIMPLRSSILFKIISDMIGVVIEADEDKSFSNPDTILVVNDTLIERRNKYLIPDNKRKYGYIRYTAAPGQQLTLAEFELFADMNETKKVKYTVEGPVFDRSWPECLYDGDLMTRFTIPQKDASCILHLSEPTELSTLRLTARNDGFYALPGNSYQLFYMDGDKDWVAAGEPCVADENGIIEFYAPENALLKLKDITKDVDRQVFTIQNGKICYSIDLGFHNLVK